MTPGDLVTQKIPFSPIFLSFIKNTKKFAIFRAAYMWAPANRWVLVMSLEFQPIENFQASDISRAIHVQKLLWKIGVMLHSGCPSAPKLHSPLFSSLSIENKLTFGFGLSSQTLFPPVIAQNLDLHRISMARSCIICHFWFV